MSESQHPEGFVEESFYDWTEGAVAPDKFENGSCIVTNISLCGNKSKNGYDIPPSAFKNEAHVKGLYEEKHVYINHKRNAPFDRSVNDLAGVIRNARFVGGRPRGDIDCMENEAGRTLASLVRKGVKDTGMSHVAAYEFNRDKTVVTEVKEIATVDVVCFPATNKTFSEQTQTRNTEMNEQNDKLVLNLESQVETANGKVTTLTTEAVSLNETIKKLKAEKAELDKANVELETAKKELKLKVDEFETKDAIIVRQESIVKLCEKHKLDVADTKIACTPTFMESLSDCKDVERMESLIKDRASFLAGIQKATGKNPTSHQRQESKGDDDDDNDDGTFDTEAAWKDNKAFV